MDYLSKINLFNLTKTAKQTIALYLSQMGAMFFGVLFTIINTRLLTKSEFGTLNFYIQVLMFLALIKEWIITLNDYKTYDGIKIPVKGEAT
jgi:hypothetical protein